MGELSLGKLEVPLPAKKDMSHRMRFETPLKAELHWKAYGAPAKPDVDKWEPEVEPVMLPYGGFANSGMWW